MITYDIKGLLAAVSRDVALADGVIAHMKQRAAKQGTPVTCDGCRQAGCCYQPVAVFMAEALWMAQQHPVPAERREEFTRIGDEMERADKDAFFHAAHPCVYLNPDKSCAIYGQRPGACRRYYVINEPKLCMPGMTKKVSVLNTMELDSVWVKTMVQYQTTHLGMPPVPILMGALPKMMAIASTVLELGSGREVRRLLRVQKWLDFDQGMAQVDPEVMEAYGVSK